VRTEGVFYKPPRVAWLAIGYLVILGYAGAPASATPREAGSGAQRLLPSWQQDLLAAVTICYRGAARHFDGAALSPFPLARG